MKREGVRLKLPNGKSAVIEKEKILDYLLNEAHPDNAGKAAFFSGLGFHKDNWLNLISIFKLIAQTAEVSKSMESPHGWKYVVDGDIEAPEGNISLVRTIWIIDRGDDKPRLVTAYPRKK